MLAGKVVLIVGASGGIGADTARVLTEEGARVMIAARSEGALRALAEELGAAGHEAGWVAGDVSVAADAARFVSATVERFGRIDGAFNNAAISGRGPLHEVSEADFDRIMAVNVKGVWLSLREEVRAMREQGGGAIVNTSSVSGYKGSTGLGAYQATKHAVIGMTRTAAHDNGPAGIRVNAIAPGPIETPMLDDMRATMPAGVEARIAATPLRKTGTTWEVAQAVAWLLSDRSTHISGTVLPIEGGMTA
jgi:NAD(P)-dependent dehydrogenase (short-subunit alcohol dehydrogenase family)